MGWNVNLSLSLSMNRGTTQSTLGEQNESLSPSSPLSVQLTYIGPDSGELDYV